MLHSFSAPACSSLHLILTDPLKENDASSLVGSHRTNQSFTSQGVAIARNTKHSLSIEVDVKTEFKMFLFLKRLMTLMVFVAIFIGGILCHIFIKINDVDVNAIGVNATFNSISHT